MEWRLQLTEALRNKIDGFQMKGLCKIPGKKNTFWDRMATKENVLDLANWILTRDQGNKEHKGRDLGRPKKTRRMEEIKDRDSGL